MSNQEVSNEDALEALKQKISGIQKLTIPMDGNIYEGAELKKQALTLIKGFIDEYRAISVENNQKFEENAIVIYFIKDGISLEALTASDVSLRQKIATYKALGIPVISIPMTMEEALEKDDKGVSNLANLLKSSQIDPKDSSQPLNIFASIVQLPVNPELVNIIYENFPANLDIDAILEGDELVKIGRDPKERPYDEPATAEAARRIHERINPPQDELLEVEATLRLQEQINPEKQPVAIVGGKGHLGKMIAEKLKLQGYKVKIFDKEDEEAMERELTEYNFIISAANARNIIKGHHLNDNAHLIDIGFIPEWSETKSTLNEGINTNNIIDFDPIEPDEQLIEEVLDNLRSLENLPDNPKVAIVKSGNQRRANIADRIKIEMESISEIDVDLISQKDIADNLNQYDIVIAAGDKKNSIQPDQLKAGSQVIDVRFGDLAMYGSLDENAIKKAKWVSKVPGGMGQTEMVLLAERSFEVLTGIPIRTF